MLGILCQALYQYKFLLFKIYLSDDLALWLLQIVITLHRLKPVTEIVAIHVIGYTTVIYEIYENMKCNTTLLKYGISL